MKCPIPGLDTDLQEKLTNCADAIIVALDHFFPEFRNSWNKDDPGQFENRVFMSLYMELIHAGFFKFMQEQINGK